MKHEPIHFSVRPSRRLLSNLALIGSVALFAPACGGEGGEDLYD